MTGPKLPRRSRVDHNRIILDRVLQFLLGHFIERAEGRSMAPRLRDLNSHRGRNRPERSGRFAVICLTNSARSLICNAQFSFRSWPTSEKGASEIARPQSEPAPVRRINFHFVRQGEDFLKSES